MQSRALRYFLAVYDSCNLSVAAGQVHVTQPALSRAIRQLEEEMGVPLFERRPHGLEPTRFADILARHGRRMDMEYRHALAEIEMADGGAAAMLRIGAGPIWYSLILPSIFPDFLRENPKVRLKVQSGVISTLVPQLMAGQYDLICSTLDFPAQAGLVRESIFEVEHALIGRREHPLARRLVEQPDALSPQEIVGFSWIVLADDQVGTGRILSYFAAHELPPPLISIETSSPTHMFEMLSRGDWLAQIPRRLLPLAERYNLREFPVHGAFWSARAGICYRTTDPPSLALLSLIRRIRETTEIRI
ncbi:LysR family transcriptional regulator [Paracoccus sp. 22332]|uniref:LysR family transcriptional regulator n=1 Tax=Paracoccus sp. 22332 TaxID=3453913 RepID=UPI003F87501A